MYISEISIFGLFLLLFSLFFSSIFLKNSEPLNLIFFDIHLNFDHWLRIIFQQVISGYTVLRRFFLVICKTILKTCITQYISIHISNMTSLFKLLYHLINFSKGLHSPYTNLVYLKCIFYINLSSINTSFFTFSFIIQTFVLQKLDQLTEKLLILKFWSLNILTSFQSLTFFKKNFKHNIYFCQF